MKFVSWNFFDRGLLFKQTSSTVNDSNVRVRQYANLEAKHMGFLEKDDKVQVLDQSALKRTIDPWGEHYWYQIKGESDGFEQRQLKSILSASFYTIFK